MLPSSRTDLQRAVHLARSGRIAEAQAICQAAMKRDRRNPLLHAIFGEVAEARGNLEEAAGHYRKSISLDPKQVMTHIALGQVRTYQGRYKEAIASLERALRVLPGSPHALAALADTYDKQGQPARALELLAPIIERGEETPQMAVVASTVLMNRGEHERAVELARRHVDRPETPANARQLLGFTLGRALEALGRYDESFAAYKAANEAICGEFQPEKYVAQIDALIDVFSRDRLARLPRSTQTTELPVFIAGMPRSGTTLVERIVNAHPRGRGAGEIITLQRMITELPLLIHSDQVYPRCVLDADQQDLDRLARQYLEALASLRRDAARIVDKNLTNWMNLGLIALLFPRARIIHCRRDPLDTCFSCFTSSLDNRANPWAGSLEGIAVVYRQHLRLMAHWRQTLELSMLQVDYEAVIDDQEGQSRRLIEFLGLEWDERCLKFHEPPRSAAASGIAPTLSYDQVRRPVYRTAIGRTRAFQSHLGALIGLPGAGS